MKKASKVIQLLFITFILLFGSHINASANGLQGFDKAYYLSAKLNALQAAHSEWAGKTVNDLEVFLLDAGFTTEQHYSQYGYLEGLSPNQFFNPTEYTLAKGTAIYSSGGYPSIGDAVTAFKGMWPGNIYLHYLLYGAAEGLNPSNSFDESTYLLDKLTRLNASGTDWNGKTINDLRIYFAGINMTVLSHYLQYGQYEGMSATPVITDPSINKKPIASSITLNVNSSVPYFQQQLIGQDPDGDRISYELISSASGVGYSLAYVNSSTGLLYITNEFSGNDSFTLSYRVSDGQLFSDPATIEIQVTYLSEDEKDTGKNDVDPEEYASFDLSTYNSDLLGSNSTPAQPNSIDLSSNFPIPGDQGQQNSCVGWATAYALKTYQEKVATGWSLNTPAHLFSPAFIYNQIVIGNDQGSYINDALDLAMGRGISTLSTMPYSDRDYVTQPSVTAFTEAAQYKASRWSRINDTSQIKAALVNRKPVVCGISVYESLIRLNGTNSVYNTASGKNLGGHAVTIVGYDNSKFGGAFKIINSWSTNWGDNGYFWLPYSFASQGIMNEAYVLEDAENTSPVAPEDPTEPVPDNTTLPNLTVKSWEASYSPNPGGTGTLMYNIINNGSGTAFAGADINLILSKNTEITSSDDYVVYEEIPFDLLPGRSVYRDASNSLSFRFPDQIEPGIYYLALWVDDLGKVAESNENDNISKGKNTITIETTLPDLNVASWYAEWDGNGSGSLTYEVTNSGASATTTTSWDINLILDHDQILGNNNEILLYYENAGFILNPGGKIYRDSDKAASFNIYKDYYGNTIPSGVYYMALWVDDLNQVNESNESNNGSYSWGMVRIGTGTSASQQPESEAMHPKKYITGLTANQPGTAYNAKKLTPKNIVRKKIEISRTPEGNIIMKQLDKKIKTDPIFQTKLISSGTKLIFPSGEEIPMPGESE